MVGQTFLSALDASLSRADRNVCPTELSMSSTATIDELLADLNPQQREAATHGDRPLLIVAGAGTGKTATLVHRVAWLIAQGVDPGRILLLTFTRRAAAEMLRRAENLLRRLGHARHDPRLGRNLSRHRHPAAAPLRQGHRPAARVHRPRPHRLRRPAERRPHRLEPGQDRQAVPEEGHLHGDLQPVRQRPRKARRRAAASFPLVQGLARRAEAAFRRLRGPQRGGRRARLRRPAALTGTPCWPTPWDEAERVTGATPVCTNDSDSSACRLIPGDGSRRRRHPPAVRLRAGRRISGHQHAPGRHPLRALAGGQGADRGGRRRPVDLRLPRGHRAEHPRLPQALPERHDRHAGAELPQHAADPGGHQPRDRPGPRAIYQKPLVRAGRGRAAAGWSTARTTRTRPSTSSARFWSTARRASICGGRPCSSGRRTTACCWKPSWPGPTSPSTSTAG